MDEQIKYSAEQLQMLKTANAHGFINHLVTDGVPDPANPGKTRSVTVKEATDLYAKAIKRQENVTKQAAEVKNRIRQHLAPAGK